MVVNVRIFFDKRTAARLRQGQRASGAYDGPQQRGGIHCKARSREKAACKLPPYFQFAIRKGACVPHAASLSKREGAGALAVLLMTATISGAVLKTDLTVSRVKSVRISPIFLVSPTVAS